MSFDPSLLPRLSESDPPSASEGSLDPLGLAGFAGHLADSLVPGFTERTRRPRALTFIAVGAFVLGRREGGVYGEHPGEGNASVGFERLVLESWARQGDRKDRGYFGIPGIGKARDAADWDVRLQRRVYLKSPEAAGLWVAYKGLAVDLRILDQTGCLQENGRVLLDAWERGIGRPGLLTSSGSDSEDNLARLDFGLDPLLGHRVSDKRRPQAAWTFITEHLSPQGLTRPEAEVIQRLLFEPCDRRREVFREASNIVRPLEPGTDLDEAEIVEQISNTSGSIRSIARAICRYEALAALLMEAWYAILRAGSRKGNGQVDPGTVGANTQTPSSFASMAARVAPTATAAFEALAEAGHEIQTRAALQWIDGPGMATTEGLFFALLERHRAVQSMKPPEGKRPWIEGEAGHYYVRTRYFVEEEREPGTWVHPYRLGSVLSFLSEFGGTGIE